MAQYPWSTVFRLGPPNNHKIIQFNLQNGHCIFNSFAVCQVKFGKPLEPVGLSLCRCLGAFASKKHATASKMAQNIIISNAIKEFQLLNRQ